MKCVFYSNTYTRYRIQMQITHYILYKAQNGLVFFEDANKSDVMDWMITYQDVRRNMCEAEKIYANDKVSARRIEEENEKKRLEGNRKGADITNRHSVSVQMDADLNTPEKCRDRSTNTREQLAKMAGVGTGTVAKYC